MNRTPEPPLRRLAERDLEAALADTRVAVVLGARQVGKSTLVEQIARSRQEMGVHTLDDQATRSRALADPTGFVADLTTPAAIDEVQRAPDILLAIKQRVDRDQSPGQFILTGSANVLTAPTISDALTGRAAYILLHPFTQGELKGHRESFIEMLFEGHFPALHDQALGRGAYASLIAAGGYPEALKRTGSRRTLFFDGYLKTLMQRDLRSLAALSDGANVQRLLAALAAVSTSEVNFQSLGRDLGLAGNTLRTYANLLETLFLIRRVPPWSGNMFARAIKAPKAYISDPGLLCHLVRADETRIKTDLDLGGMLFETFAACELMRQADYAIEPVEVYHYRDRDQRQVDLLFERRDGAVIAVEIKAAASIKQSDGRGLAYLRDKLGDRFRAGALLYTGAATLRLGDRLAAVPLTGLWTDDASG